MEQKELIIFLKSVIDCTYPLCQSEDREIARLSASINNNSYILRKYLISLNSKEKDENDKI